MPRASTAAIPALGRLISPPFTVQRRYLSFLIGGGRHTYYGNNDPGYVAVNLVHDGHVVRTAPRSQWAPDGCDHLAWDWFDLDDLAGTQVRVEIVDQHTGPWGHILVDQIAQTDTPPVSLPSFAERRFRAGHRFFNLPISLRSPFRELQLTGGGRTVASNTVCLARDDPDFWVPVDLSAWQGMDLTLRIEDPACSCIRYAKRSWRTPAAASASRAGTRTQGQSGGKYREIRRVRGFNWFP